MFSGKTSSLINTYRHYNFCKIPVAVITHLSDKRYDDSLLSTHDKVTIDCIFTDSLNSLFLSEDLIQKNQIFLINEAQFFTDLKEFVNALLEKGKKVYLYGLDGDFQKKQFGQIIDLIPICDKIRKLNALCAKCCDGTPGIFSMRLTEEKNQFLIGGADKYIPVCRNCHITVP
jgi:thymidine kinase